MKRRNSPQTAVSQGPKRKPFMMLELFVVSVNYIVITYALSNMALFFKASPLYVLFFASEIWAFSCFWNYLYKRTKHKIMAAMFIGICFLIHIGMVYGIGHIAGTIIPFR